jgi:hypothetical protein
MHYFKNQQGLIYDLPCNSLLDNQNRKKPATGKTGHSFCNGKKLLLSVYEEAVCNFDHRSI